MKKIFLILIIIFLIMSSISVFASTQATPARPASQPSYDIVIANYLEDFELKPSRKIALQRLISGQINKVLGDYQGCQGDFLKIVFQVASAFNFTEEQTIQYFAMMSAESGCTVWSNQNRRIGVISGDRLFRGVAQIGPVWYNNVVLSTETRTRPGRFLSDSLRSANLFTINEEIQRNRYGSRFGGENNTIDSDAEFNQLKTAIRDNTNPYASAILGATIYKNILKVIESESANSTRPFVINNILSNSANFSRTHQDSVDLFYATCYSYKYTSGPIKFKLGIKNYTGVVGNNADTQIAVKMAKYIVLKEIFETTRYDNTEMKERIIANYSTYYKSTYRRQCFAGEYDESIIAQTIGDDPLGIGSRSVNILTYNTNENLLTRMCPLPIRKNIVLGEKRMSDIDILKYNCVIDDSNPNCHDMAIGRTFLCSKVAVTGANKVFGLNYIRANAWDLIYENNVIWEKESNRELKLVPGTILGVYLPTSNYLYRQNENNLVLNRNNIPIRARDINGRDRQFTHVVLYLGDVASRRNQILHMNGSIVETVNLDQYITFTQGILRNRITLNPREDYTSIEKNNTLYWVSTKNCYPCFDGYYCQFKDIDNNPVVYDKLCNPRNPDYLKFRPLYNCCNAGTCDCQASISRVIYPKYTNVETVEELYSGYYNIN